MDDSRLIGVLLVLLGLIVAAWVFLIIADVFSKDFDAPDAAFLLGGTIGGGLVTAIIKLRGRNGDD